MPLLYFSFSFSFTFLLRLLDSSLFSSFLFSARLTASRPEILLAFCYVSLQTSKLLPLRSCVSEPVLASRSPASPSASHSLYSGFDLLVPFLWPVRPSSSSSQFPSLMSHPSSSAQPAPGSQQEQPTYEQLALAFQQIQTQLTQTRNQLATTQAQAQRNLPKPAKPDTFNGRPSANADAWLFQMETYMATTGVSGDPTRVQFAVAFLRDMASTWWCTVVQHADPPQEWEAFKTRFLDRFRPVEAARTARVALSSIRQRGSVADYTNAFLRHMQHITDMAEADKVQFYLRGLQLRIWDEVDMKGPTTLEQAMNYAQRADLRRASRQQVSLSSFRPPYDSRPTWTVPRAAESHSSVPMELGYTSSANEPDEPSDSCGEQDGTVQGSQLSAFSSRPSSRPAPRTPPKLSPEERERCMRDRLCFRCRRPGHVSARCPTYADRQGKGQGQ